MAKTSRTAVMDSASKRRDMAAGKLHMEPLRTGGYLLYRRNRDGMAGNWFARWHDPETGKQTQSKLAVADDHTGADGVSVMTYQQAKDAAQEFFKSASRRADMKATGVKLHVGDYLVRDAVADYIASLRAAGKNSADDFEMMAGKWIVPMLGDLKVKRLTKVRLEQWRTEIAAMPKRGKKEVGTDPDQIRRRKDSANHVLVILKTALSYAVKTGRVDPPAAGGWGGAEYFDGVHVSRTRFLNADEQRALVAACDDDFRPLVTAALYCGARYMDIANLRVKHFRPADGTVWFGPFGKTKTARFVHLTGEAVAWFRTQVEGKQPEDRIFTRRSQRRFANRGQGNDGIWIDSDQGYYMIKAWTKAAISPVVFHELRHTYASMLLSSGIPIAYVAAQLGNSIQICQKHYGHLCKDAVADSIRSLVPALKLS